MVGGPVERARPRRSSLSVPGSSPKMMAKAPSLPADEVFFDLEDSVLPDRKKEARDLVVKASPTATGPPSPSASGSTALTPGGAMAT
jgi:hypothetical protein